MLHLIHIMAIITMETSVLIKSPLPLIENDTVFKSDYPADTIKNPARVTSSLDARRENVLRPGEKAYDKIRKNIFIKVSTNKTSCYVGEPILAEYKLYSRLAAKSRIIKQPSLNGFTVYDMIDFVPLAESVETVQGKRFKVHTLRKTQLIPLQTGTLALDPIELENTVEFIKSKDLKPRKGNQLDDLLDGFLDEERAPAITQAGRTASNPVSLTVNPLPDNDRPSHFTGAVGRFTISAIIDSPKLIAQNAAVLTIEISGKGNLALIDAPAIPWPTGFEIMDTRSSEELNKSVIPLEGTKRFEYSFIPEKEGDYSIPPVSFAYFDPSGKIYKTVSSQPVLLRVAAGDRVIRPSRKPDFTGLQSGKKDKSVPAFLKAHFALILIVLLALIGILFIWMQMLHRGIKKSIPDLCLIQSDILPTHHQWCFRQIRCKRLEVSVRIRMDFTPN